MIEIMPALLMSTGFGQLQARIVVRSARAWCQSGKAFRGLINSLTPTIKLPIRGCNEFDSLDNLLVLGDVHLNDVNLGFDTLFGQLVCCFATGLEAARAQDEIGRVFLQPGNLEDGIA